MVGVLWAGERQKKFFAGLCGTPYGQHSELHDQAAAKSCGHLSHVPVTLGPREGKGNLDRREKCLKLGEDDHKLHLPLWLLYQSLYSQ